MKPTHFKILKCHVSLSLTNTFTHAHSLKVARTTPKNLKPLSGNVAERAGLSLLRSTSPAVSRLQNATGTASSVGEGEWLSSSGIDSSTVIHHHGESRCLQLFLLCVWIRELSSTTKTLSETFYTSSGNGDPPRSNLLFGEVRWGRGGTKEKKKTAQNGTLQEEKINECPQQRKG